jgi:outer membrane protein TolC
MARNTLIDFCRRGGIAAALVLAPSLAIGQEAGTVHLTLGDAARLAADRNAGATSAREQASQAEARSRQFRADLLPQLSASGEAGSRTYNTSTLGIDFPTVDQDGQVQGPVRSIDMRFRVTQRLVDLPAVARWRASSAAASAAHAAARASAEDKARRGALAYLRVSRADAQLAARIADSTLADELVTIAKQQLAAGTAIALDVTRAQTRLAAATAQLIDGRSERARAELELLHTLALPVETRIVLSDSLRLPAGIDVSLSEDQAVRFALQRRFDVQAAEATMSESRLKVNAARAERLPSIELFGDQGTSGKSADHLLGTYTYGVQLTIPVLDGFRREARIDEERSRQREAELRWRDARLRTEVDVRSALLDIAAARERVVAAQVQLQLAEKEVAQAQERFRAGIADNSDVIAASLSLNSARDTFVNAIAAYHGARVELASAQGNTTALP